MTLRKSDSDNEIVKTGIEWDNINKKICRSLYLWNNAFNLKTKNQI